MIAELNRKAEAKDVRHGVACLLFSFVLLACVSNAGASNISYNIVDYPANEADAFSGTDTISGTIITDGTIGPLSTADIIGGSFSFTGAYGNLSGPAWFGNPVGLQATPTQLLLDPGAESSFSIGTTEFNSQINSLGADAVYVNYPGSGQYYGGLVADNGALQAVLASFRSAGPGVRARGQTYALHYSSGPRLNGTLCI